MSFFPRALVGPDPTTSFTPLFRLLDDFDTYSRGGNSNLQHHHRRHLKSFNPRFDVKEVADGYELHGELPGVEQKDIEIEFTDSQTISIRGRTERSYTAGNPPAGLLGEGRKTGAITDGSESHTARVEDEDEASEAKTTEVATTAPKEQPKEDEKFWVSERSIGEFSRSFSFPTRVDQDAVKASMKNGILSISVPKLKQYESKKIAISS